ELVKDICALVGRLRLRERAAQMGDGVVRRSSRERLMGGVPERLDHESVRAWGRVQKLRRHLLARRTAAGEDLCGLRMVTLTLSRREPVVDGSANDRVDEGERQLATDDVRPAERRGGVRRKVLIETGESGRGVKLDVVAENRHGTRESAGL